MRRGKKTALRRYHEKESEEADYSIAGSRKELEVEEIEITNE